MGRISLTSPTAGTTITAGLHATNYGLIQTVVNGNLDNSNINASAAIDYSKLNVPASTIAVTKLTPGTNGQVLTTTGGVAAWGTSAAQIGAEQAYVEFTAGVGCSATTEGTANTIVTAGAFTADGTSAYLIEFFCPSITTPAAGGATVDLVLYEDGSSIGKIGRVLNAGASEIFGPVSASRRRVSASGSRTYSIRGFVSSGTGTANAGAGGNGNVMPGYIRVTKAT
jgi:hypothetical protein